MTFTLDTTLKLICASTVVVAVVYVFSSKSGKSSSITNKIISQRAITNTSMRGVESHYYKSVETSKGLPIACVSTFGGDIMMCPSSGVCPLNGTKCQPQPDSKPCCTDWYPPTETWYYPDMPSSWLSYK